jgi:hypothetical protein
MWGIWPCISTLRSILVKTVAGRASATANTGRHLDRGQPNTKARELVLGGFAAELVLFALSADSQERSPAVSWSRSGHSRGVPLTSLQVSCYR